MLRARPDQASARLRLADRLAQRGDVESAIIEYFSVVESYVENDLHEKAVRLLRRMSELAPGRGDVDERLAKLSGVAATLARRDLHIARLARRAPATLQPSSIDAAELRRFWNEFGASPVVTELDDGALALLLAACEVQRIGPMTVVVRAGQWQPRCYLIAEGGIEAGGPGPGGKPASLLRFGPGDVIGDRALLEDAPWAAEHRTTDEASTTVLRLTRRRLAELAQDEEQLELLFGVLRRHGRDRDVEAVLRRPKT
jgi:CRP-like cAMP-binding protein